ncbi:uncharacterized protein LOC125049820 [Pieris napi]|uniref:uncharacterized protein LOC125049820 n=1 Tax=Pieris napi TaxID=78633 RepID=UPI001FB8EC4D|nr:uncharacterized protein LOC125049820 [Pieris napi]
MADTKVNIAKRGYAKMSITKIHNALLSGELQSRSLERLIVVRDRVVSVFQEYSDACIQICAQNPEDPEDFSKIEEIYFDILSNIDKTIKKHNLNTKNETLNDSDCKQTSSIRSKLQLPNIVMSTFTGKYTEYYSFINLFSAMIDKDESLSPVQKLYYLKGFLSDEPAALIKNLPLEDDSYAEAIKLLKERYDIKTKIIHEHIHTLLDLQPITRSTPNTIRKLISDVKQTLAALKNLEEPVDSCSSLLVCVLVRKLDNLTRSAFQMERDNKCLPTVGELLGYLERRALSLENDSVPNKQPQPQRLTSIAVTAPASTSCTYCPVATP